MTSLDVSNSLRFLLNAGFLTVDAKGHYQQTNRSLTTGRLKVVSVAVHSLLRQMGEFALEALDKLPISERHFSGVTMGMTAESYEKVIEELTECRKRIVSIVSADKKVEKVSTMCWKNSATVTVLSLAVTQNRIPVLLPANSMVAAIASIACTQDFGIKKTRL